jgi:hypothetical protein
MRSDYSEIYQDVQDFLEGLHDESDVDSAVGAFLAAHGWTWEEYEAASP